MFGNRWYDQHPKVSLAVGCLENANDSLRNKLAKVIIKQALKLGISAKRPKGGLFRRWYDKDKDLSLAMEYFRNGENRQRVEIADYVITYIRERGY